MFDRVFGYRREKTAMGRGNTDGFQVGIERSRESPLLRRISHEILRDLGMSDDAIAQYFYRFRHGQTEQFVQTVMRKHGWMCNSWRGRMSNDGAAAWLKRNITLSRRKEQGRLA
jgi:hypothetical protein